MNRNFRYAKINVSFENIDFLWLTPEVFAVKPIYFTGTATRMAAYRPEKSTLV